MATLKLKASWKNWPVAVVAAMSWIGQQIKKLFGTPASEKETRRLRKQRQKQVRRALRGLDVPEK